jgi:uncharacterized protein (DUF2235 family)
MSKTLVFCADGTWNGPDQDEDKDHVPDVTNVYKLYCGLLGTAPPGTDNLKGEDERVLVVDGQVVQVAKYLHGVGDTSNVIHRIIEGIFGAGMIQRIVRGYTFLSRNYEPGDSIVIVGFSRGAYTARALAGLIVSQGLLAKRLTTDKAQAYNLGALAWKQYRQNSPRHDEQLLEKLVEMLAIVQALFSGDKLRSDDLVPVESVKAVAVWDTVGALGLPDYIKDSRADTFKFTNTILSNRVEHGFHAVALDERRIDFSPTLWSPRAGIEQVAFAGAHADVGGGYPAKGGESQLSNISLAWMADRLRSVGVQFKPDFEADHPASAGGPAHRPWNHSPFTAFGKASRAFDAQQVEEHVSVKARIALGPVQPDPEVPAEPYAPANRPVAST